MYVPNHQPVIFSHYQPLLTMISQDYPIYEMENHQVTLLLGRSVSHIPIEKNLVAAPSQKTHGFTVLGRLEG